MNNTKRIVASLVLLVAFAMLGVYGAIADPTGATILSNSTAGQPSSTAGNRTDAGGTITTIVLTAVQQDTRWKAYVGNVSGRLSLDNAAGQTIYDWDIAATSIAGEVYVTRHSSVLFGNLTCGNLANVTAESAHMNMSLSQSDGLNRTFNYTSHTALTIGTAPPVNIGADSCRSTATYVSDARQNMNGAQDFQELLLQDPNSRVVFVGFLDNDATGYDGGARDFQIIVPENPNNLTPTTYFFYTELDG